MDLGKKCKVNLPPPHTNFDVNSCKLIKRSRKSNHVEHFDVRVFLLKDDRCEKYANQVNADLVECAGSIVGPKAGVCPNESGAVLLCQVYGDTTYHLRAMSSWGDIFCEKSNSYFYTSIQPYFEWINSTIWTI